MSIRLIILSSEGEDVKMFRTDEFLDYLEMLADTPEEEDKTKCFEVKDRIYEIGEGTPPSNFLGDLYYREDSREKRYGWIFDLNN